MLSFRHVLTLATGTALALGIIASQTYAAEGDEIVIHSAIWSGKSVLESAKKHCEEGGKSRCDYLVTPRFIGEATNPANRSFSMEWSCTSDPKNHQTKKIPHDATNQRFVISCPAPTPVVPGKPSKQAQYTYSFRNVILSGKHDAEITPDLGAACLGAVRKVLADGYVLRSKHLERLIIPFTDKLPSGKLYHHTKLESLKSELKAMPTVAAQMDHLFKYVRTREAKALWKRSEDYFGGGEGSQNFRRFGWREFYTAATRDGSEQYGPILFTLTLDPSAKIMLYNPDAWKAAVTDLGEQFPAIKENCDLRFGVSYDALGHVQFQNFVTVMAEEMGVDVVDYYQQDTWFMLNSPVSVTGLQIN